MPQLRVDAVACGKFHTLFLDRGRVYAAGGNTFGQLGRGNKKSSARPEEVATLAEKGVRIAMVSCWNYSAAVSTKGELYLWGTGAFGTSLLPQEFPLQKNKEGATGGRVIEVSVGGTFSGAIDEDENVYVWGANVKGELGTSDYEPRTRPFLVPVLKGNSMRQLAIGGGFAVALGRTIPAKGAARKQDVAAVETKQRETKPNKESAKSVKKSASKATLKRQSTMCD